MSAWNFISAVILQNQAFDYLEVKLKQKIFSVLITWLGSVHFTNLCHSGTNYTLITVHFVRIDLEDCLRYDFDNLMKKSLKNTKKYALKILLL